MKNSCDRSSTSKVADNATLTDHQLEPTEVCFPARASPIIWGYLTPVESEVRVGTFDQPKQRYAVGDFRLVRPGKTIRRLPSRPTAIRSIALPTGAFSQFVEQSDVSHEGELDKMERDTFRSNTIEVLSRSLAKAQRERASEFFTQTLAHSIVYEVWSLSHASLRTQTAAGCLSASLLSLIDEFIHDMLGEKIDLNALAGVSDMPVYRFARAFKETTGLTPYQHVMNLRLQKASDMIASTQLSLAEIAYTCGFSSQSHMTDAFRSRLGISPGRLRGR